MIRLLLFPHDRSQTDMAAIRANCPSCGQVDMSAEAISLQIASDGERGQYAFTCPDCSTDVTRPADPKVVAVLLAAGANPHGVPEERSATAQPSLPAEDRNPCPNAPAFTLDDVIDLHFLLQNHA
jgi:endogenous inhibitor of DNA gyrase (YacG/DUF329 family)